MTYPYMSLLRSPPQVSTRANPYHDDKGKFTTGGGGSGAHIVGSGKGGSVRLSDGMDSVEAKTFLNEHYGNWRNDLTTKQDAALRFYQSPGFALMNGQLRGLATKDIKASVSFNESDLARARQASAALESAIKSAPPLKTDVMVFRGFSADQFGELKPGMVVQDRAFVSTSLTNDVAAVGAARTPAVAEIRLPAGTRAGAGGSRELILGTDTKFRVLAVDKVRGNTVVRMEAVA